MKYIKIVLINFAKNIQLFQIILLRTLFFKNLRIRY